MGRLDFIDQDEYEDWKNRQKERERQRELDAQPKKPTSWQLAMSRPSFAPEPDISATLPISGGTTAPLEAPEMTPWQRAWQPPALPETMPNYLRQGLDMGQQQLRQRVPGYAGAADVLGKGLQAEAELGRRSFGKTMEGLDWIGRNVNMPQRELMTGPAARGEIDPRLMAAASPEDIEAFSAATSGMRVGEALKRGQRPGQIWQEAGQRWEETQEPAPGIKGILEAGVPSELALGVIPFEKAPQLAAKGVQAVRRGAEAAEPAIREALPEAGRMARQLAVDETGSVQVGGLLGKTEAPPSKRYYHGTGSAFDAPDAAKFDPDGLYGPGYYMTSDPMVANSYSLNRAPNANNLSGQLGMFGRTREELKRRILEAKSAAERADLEEGLANTEAQIKYLQDKSNTGANIRLIDVPEGVRLLDVDAPLSELDKSRIRNGVLTYKGQMEPSGITNFESPQDFANALPKFGYLRGEQAYDTLKLLVGPKQVNEILAKEGYDGIRYQGGKRLPIKDDAGQPIEHEAVVIFPESLHKITNALSKTQGGQAQIGPALDLGGGAVGAFSQYDPEASFEENAARMAVGGLAGAGLTYGARKGLTALGRNVNSEILPEAGRVARELAIGERGGAELGDVLGKGTRRKPLSPLEQAKERLEQAKGTPEQAAALRPEEERFAGNINLSKGEPANVPLTEAVMDNPEYSQMAGQRRGVISDVQAVENAEQVAQKRSIEDWLNIKPGTALNEEEALALRSTTEKVGNEYRQMQVEVMAARTAGALAPADEAKLAEKALEFAALTAVRSGAAAEAGRALRSFRLIISGEFGSQERAIQKAFEVLGGGDSFRKWVDEFNRIDPANRAAQIKHLQKLTEPTIWEKINAYRYANMLSSWKTHQVNTISNAMEAVSRPIETALAGYAGEAKADVYGMMRGIPEGLQSAIDALKTGVSKYETSKLETGSARPRPLGYGKLGRAAALPSDLLIAADDFWKSVNYSGAIHADAYRLAKGDVQKAEELVANPTDAMIERAQQVAKYATYQNDPNEFVKRIVNLANTPGVGGFAFRLFVPFIRTPANIYTRGLGMILQPLSGPVKMGIRAAKGDMRAVRLEAAKTAIASSTLAGLWGMAASGNLTGQGPSDAAKRRILEESGWQSNSIKIGDRWLRYSNLGPVSIPMAAVAAVKEGLDEGKRPNREMLTDAISRVYNSMLDVSFVQGLSDLLRGDGIVGGLAQVGVSAAGSLVPYSAGLAAAERTIDPTYRAKDDPMAAVQGRIPIASQLLPAEPSIYGGTRQQGEGDTLAQILLPWPTSKERQDPVANEVARLNQSDEARQAGVAVSVRQFGDTYAGAKQTPEQRRRLQGEAGQLAATYIADMISRPAYQNLSDAQKATTLNKALGTAYEIADLKLGEQLNRDDRHKALLAWASVPQYEGVKGKPEEVRLENYEIAQAKAKRAEYRKQYGDATLGDYKLIKEDKKAYQLAQRARLDSDYLKIKKQRVDKQFGGALSQAEKEALVGAGNTVLPVGSSR